MQTIVAGVGPAFWEDPVLPTALNLAARCGSELHVVRAFDPPARGADESSKSSEAQDSIEQRQREMLVGLQGQIEALGGDDRVHSHVLIGSPAQVVDRLARLHDADLVVIGAARKQHLPLRMLGSKAERIIANSQRPVLVIRAPIDAPIRRVLYATDQSPQAGRLFERGREVVASVIGESGVESRCVRVIWGGESSDEAAGGDGDAAGRALDSLRRFLADHDGGDVEPRVQTSMPAGGILTEAREWPADLVVMGTRAPATAERILMGSVSASVLRDLKGNALVIPLPAAQGSEEEGAEERLT